MRHVSVSISCLFLLTVVVRAEQFPIEIDGRFDDWANVPVALQDGADGQVDLGRIWVADDPDFLFIRFESNAEFDLSDNNTLSIHIDTDGDSTSGLLVDGMGAEIVFGFGDKIGRFYPTTTSNPNNGTQIWHDSLRFQGLPTVTSTQFEIAFAKDSVVEGAPVFQGSVVRFAIADSDADGIGDLIEYQLMQGDTPQARDEPLGRERPTDVRHMSWNVLNDSPWSSGCGSRFGRIIQALNPDILSFQEIYDHSGNQVRAFVEDWIDPAPASTWHVASNNDCHVVSRYEILVSEAIDGNLAALLDTTDVLERTTLVINAHFPCCDNEDGRQGEVDRILRFLRRVRTSQLIEYPSDCALIITGDLNLVGLAQQLDSLVEGDIVDEGAYGPDVEPDVDGSDLLDVVCFQTEARLAYTWRNDYGWYWPGRLDFTIISDSVLELGNRLVVETDAMSSGNLAEYGLLSGDSDCSDHRALVCDLRKPGCPADINGDGYINGADLAVVLGFWGPCKGGSACQSDLDGDGVVGGSDLAIVLGFWGVCSPG